MLANRPFLVFDYWAFWCSGLSARVPESQTKNGQLASLVSLSLTYCPHYGTLGKIGLNILSSLRALNIEGVCRIHVDF